MGKPIFIRLIYVGIPVSCNTWPYTRYKFSEKLKLSFVFWTMWSRHYFVMLLILLMLVLFLAYPWFPTGKSSNESDSCLAWKAVFGTLLSTVAIILICYLLYLHGEWLLNAAHVHWERLRTAVQGLFGHHVIYRDEFRGESLNCKALTERPTTTDTFKVNCSGGPQTTSLGTEESYPLPQTFEQPADPL